MSDSVRYTFSIEQPLADRLERMVKNSKYENRSKFLCDLIRNHLVKEEWERDQEALGTISMLYDHHQRQLLNALADLQHDHDALVICTTHVHLSHDLCAEMLMVRGGAGLIRDLYDRIRRLRGVLHATLGMSSTGKRLN